MSEDIKPLRGLIAGIVPVEEIKPLRGLLRFQVQFLSGETEASPRARELVFILSEEIKPLRGL